MRPIINSLWKGTDFGELYNKIEQGIPMVVCDRTTPLGIRYILIHESFED